MLRIKADGTGDALSRGTGRGDLPESRPFRAGEEPKGDFAEDQRRECRDLVRGIEQTQKPADRVEERWFEVDDSEPTHRSPERRDRRAPGEEFADHGRVDRNAHS